MRNLEYIQDNYWERGMGRSCLGSPTQGIAHDPPLNGSIRGHDEGFGRRPHETADDLYDMEPSVLGQSAHGSDDHPWNITYRNFRERSVLGQSDNEKGMGRRPHEHADDPHDMGPSVLGQSDHDAANPWGINYQSHPGRSVLGQSKRTEDKKMGSFWEVCLHKAMQDRGWNPIPQYPVMNRRLDFALFGKHVKLDIEIDGRYWHQDTDGNRKPEDHVRDAQLESAGWKVVRFWVDELERDMEACLDQIRRELC